MKEKAKHITVIAFVGLPNDSVYVNESSEEVYKLIINSQGWFSVTAHPENEAIYLNAANICYVGRKRTPIEEMNMTAPPITGHRNDDLE